MDGRRSPVLRPWIRSAEVRRERRYENGNTTTTKLTLSPLRTGDAKDSLGARKYI